MLYYCAVKGKDMGFGELHKHLTKYVRCPVKRYWCVVSVQGTRCPAIYICVLGQYVCGPMDDDRHPFI